MKVSQALNGKKLNLLLILLSVLVVVTFMSTLMSYPEQIRITPDTARVLADGWTCTYKGETQAVELPFSLPVSAEDEIVFKRMCTAEELSRGMFALNNERQHVVALLDGQEIFRLEHAQEKRPTSIYEYCIMELPPRDTPAELTVIFSNCRDGQCQLTEVYLCSTAELLTHSMLMDALQVVVLILCLGLMVTVGIATLWLKMKGSQTQRFSSLFFILLCVSLWNVTNMWSSPMFLIGYHMLSWLSYTSLMVLPIPVGFFAYYSTKNHHSRLLRIAVCCCALVAIAELLLYLMGVYALYDMVLWVHMSLALISAASVYAQIKDNRIASNARGKILIAVFSVPVALVLVAVPMFWLETGLSYSVVFLVGMLAFILLLLLEAILSLVSLQVDRRKTEAELAMLQNLSFKDGLTGMGNRRSFNEHMERIEKKTLKNALLIFLDVNALKNTNDRFGHEAGDELLVATSRCIESVFGADGQCYRLGGDEFAAIIEDPQSDIAHYNALLDDKIRHLNVHRVVPLSIARGYDLLVNQDGIRKTLSLWKSNADREMYADKMRSKMLLTREDTSMVEPEHIDEMSGILNTQGFRQNAVKLLCQHTDKAYSLWYYNIKQFKFVNDFFGYEVGDKLIKYISMLLLESIHEGETCGHISADCFASLHQIGDEEGIKAHFDYMSEHISMFLKQSNISYQLELGVGIYLLKPEDAKAPNINQMIDWANVAHKSIQSLRGSQYAIFGEEMWQQQWRELYINQTLEQAIKNGDISVWFQPQFDFMTGRVIGAEALCRWKHESLGWISPAEFVIALEHTGQIGILDAYVREETCRLMKRWASSTSMEPVSISVNISRNSLLEDRYIEDLDELLGRYDLPHRALRLEITESAYMNHPEMLVDAVSLLHEHGYIVEMDDFGSGFSSLNMLKDVPIDLLKMDIRFLQGASQRSKGAQIVNAVVRMARELNIPVLAEGVEERQQAEYLANIGCTLMQGYFFSKPLPVSEFEELLRKEKAAHGTDRKAADKQPWFYLEGPGEQGEVYDVLCADYHLDVSGRVVLIDKNFTQITGYTADDVAERALTQLDLIPEEDRTAYLTILREKLADQPTLCVKHRILCRDGRRLPVHCLGEPIVDEYTGESRTVIHLQCERQHLTGEK